MSHVCMVETARLYTHCLERLILQRLRLNERIFIFTYQFRELDHDSLLNSQYCSVHRARSCS